MKTYNLSPKNQRALIVVDLQNDFLPGGALAVEEGDQIINGINSILDIYDLVIFTKDFHPFNHKSFASQHPGKNPFEIIELNSIQQVLWPDHCVEGSTGSEFAEKLDFNKLMNKPFYIFKKGMNPKVDSYSAFYDNNHKDSTGLAEFLKQKNVKSVYVCGLAADYCAKWTALDAVKEGFETFFYLNLTRPIDRSVEGRLALVKELETNNIQLL